MFHKLYSCETLSFIYFRLLKLPRNQLESFWNYGIQKQIKRSEKLINIDFDFTRTDRTEEIVDPNGNALRSEQKTLDQTADLTAKGIPGAVTNTHPTKAELEIESA